MDQITKYIIKKISRDSDIAVIIEVLPDSSPKKVEVDGYTFLRYTDTSRTVKSIRFDSLKKFDEDFLFTLDFEFLRSIHMDLISNKTIIDENSSGTQKFKTKIRRVISKVWEEDYLFNIYICDKSRSKILKTLEYSIVDYRDSILYLEDEYGYAEEINLGGDK